MSFLEEVWEERMKMSNIKDIIDVLCQIDDIAIKSKYYSHTIPSEIDKLINTILISLIKLDKNNLKKTITSMDESILIFSVFAERMASLAVREKNIEQVKKSLFALVISSYKEDYREVLMILSLIYNAIVKIGAIPLEIFNEIASIIEMPEYIKKFPNRDEKDRIIEVMGYEESEDKDGFLYKRRKYGNF